jgi:DNA polymerase-3 subunit alpha
MLATSSSPGTPVRQDYPQVEEVTHRTLLSWEKGALGCYVTGHPLDKFRSEIARLATTTVGGLADCRDSAVVVAGVVEDFRERPTRSGRSRVAFFQLEDATARVEVVVPPAVYSDTEEKIREAVEQPVLVTATVEHTDDAGQAAEGVEDSTSVRLVLKGIDSIDDIRLTRTREVHVYTIVDGVPRGGLAQLKDVLGSHPGRCPVVLHMRIPGESEIEMALADGFGVTPDDALIEGIERALTQVRVELR